MALQIRLYFISFFLLQAPFYCFSQIVNDTIEVNGKFLNDSLKLGLPIQYSLSARHDENVEILFPDTLFDYGHFNYIGKKFFPTRTVNHVSLDSAIYTFVSFETGPAQFLSLPVFIVNHKDCTRVNILADSIYFKSLINPLEEVDGLREDVDYFQVNINDDFTRYYIIGAGATIFLILIWALFGRRIRRTYKLYLLSIQHRSFSLNFDRLRRRLKQENTVPMVEGALVLWKKYMEDLEEKPFSTYTSKEILKFIPDENLSEALKYIDKVIYGQLISQEAPASLDILESVSLSSYRNKRETVKKEFRAGA